MSFGVDLDSSSSVLDGNSTLTQFLDWPAHEHDVLYVVAGNESGPAGPVPTNEFNGITVAYSEKELDGIFRRVSASNNPNQDAVGPRTSIDIVAPGDRLGLTGPNETFPTFPDNTGTSFAAPHVTGQWHCCNNMRRPEE